MRSEGVRATREGGISRGESPPERSEGNPTQFRAGRGVADITGEAAECGMLGYGKPRQQTAGLHTRLRSRAFVIEDAAGARVLIVVNELPLPMDSVTDAVLARLAARYGDTYRATNTMITATHTHCAPGGYAGHLVYNANTRGFRPRTFAAIVDGTVEAIARAHDDLAPAALTLAHGELHDASVNRSRRSFERNPAADRAHFPDAIDPQTTALRIERDGRLVGVIDFFATHGTSMSNTNTLISADNKGYAAYHWERLVAGGDYLDGELPLVAAFAQTNAGDMSPNLELRPGGGPTDDEVENTRIIGLRQYAAARRVVEGPQLALDAVVDARATRVDLDRAAIAAGFTGDGRPHRTGRPFAAAAQLAGTDEGPGFPGFRQGRNPVWDGVSSLLYRVAPRLRDAHAPKALVLPARGAVATRVPVQLLRVGRLYLLGIPGEVTIVAGLRLRRTVAAIVGAELADVLVAGYANAYVHYVTTPEEYDGQRYEAGSTMFGRWELGALQQTAAALARAMADGTPAPDGPPPPRRAARRRSWWRPPGPDEPDVLGRVIAQPRARYRPGERVTAVFGGAHPGHDVRRGGTFLRVQREDPADWSTVADDAAWSTVADDAAWSTVADDGDWSTRLSWRRTGRHGSRTVITWDVPAGTPPGRYRIVHEGTALLAGGERAAYTATSAPFRIDAPRRPAEEQRAPTEIWLV